MDKEQLEECRKTQELMALALRLENGNPHRAAALVHSIGCRWSLALKVDELNLYDRTFDLINDHWVKATEP